jgi:shikimate dehydrogenase
VGAGGVGSAIAFAIAEEGVREIRVADLIDARAEALAARLLAAGYSAQVASPDPSGFDLVINASPVGMRTTDPLPFDCSKLGSGAIVADVVISAELSPVLRAASQRGCFVQPGSVMTDYQIPSFARFFGLQRGDWTPETIALLSGQPLP